MPDREGIETRKKIKSYTTIAKDLKRNYSDQKVLLVFDKKINKKITKYVIHDLKFHFPDYQFYILMEKKLIRILKACLKFWIVFLIKILQKNLF